MIFRIEQEVVMYIQHSTGYKASSDILATKSISIFLHDQNLKFIRNIPTLYCPELPFFKAASASWLLIYFRVLTILGVIIVKNVAPLCLEAVRMRLMDSKSRIFVLISSRFTGLAIHYCHSKILFRAEYHSIPQLFITMILRMSSPARKRQ